MFPEGNGSSGERTEERGKEEGGHLHCKVGIPYRGVACRDGFLPIRVFHEQANLTLRKLIQ